MLDLTKRYHEFFDDYTQKHGHAPDEAVLNCGKAIVDTANRYYSMGESDAKKNLPLSDSFIDGLFSQYPDVPADFCDAITNLMKYAYRTGWEDGGGMTG